MKTNANQTKLFEVNTKEQSHHKLTSQNDVVFDLTDALASPILTFSQNWASFIPERLLRLVPIVRMINLKKSIRQATYVEGAIYIYTRTLESPMDHDWVDIYTHITCKTLEDWFGEDHWNDVKAPRVLSDWLQRKLKDLLSHIYTKRREILKQRIKGEQKAAEETGIRQPNPEKKPPRSIVEQTSFDF